MSERPRTFEQIYSRIQANSPNNDPFYRLAILGYQYGDVQKGLVYETYYGKTGCHAELKIALADMIAQIRLFCINQNMDFHELQKLGQERLDDFVNKRTNGKKT